MLTSPYSSPQMISLPGYAPNPIRDNIAAGDTTPGKQTPVSAYKIPPVFWMIAFLVVGYIGIRATLED